jgi:hypothetical protein
MRVVRILVLTVAAILLIAPPSLFAAPANGKKAAKPGAELRPGVAAKPGAKAVAKPAAKPGAKAPAAQGKPGKPLTKKQAARQAALAAKKSEKQAKKQAARQAQLAEKRGVENPKKSPKVGAGKAKAPQGSATRSKKAIE